MLSRKDAQRDSLKDTAAVPQARSVTELDVVADDQRIRHHRFDIR